MALFYGRRGCTRTRHKYFPQENLMDTVIVGECGVVAGGAREFGGMVAKGVKGLWYAPISRVNHLIDHIHMSNTWGPNSSAEGFLPM